MKSLFFALIVILAAMTFTSCSDANAKETAKPSQTKVVRVRRVLDNTIWIKTVSHLYHNGDTITLGSKGLKFVIVP